MNELTNINGSFISNIRITKTISFDMLSKPTSKRPYVRTRRTDCMCVLYAMALTTSIFIGYGRVKSNQTIHFIVQNVKYCSITIVYNIRHCIRNMRRKEIKNIAGVQYSMCFWRLLFIRYITQ